MKEQVFYALQRDRTFSKLSISEHLDPWVIAKDQKNGRYLIVPWTDDKIHKILTTEIIERILNIGNTTLNGHSYVVVADHCDTEIPFKTIPSLRFQMDFYLTRNFWPHKEMSEACEKGDVSLIKDLLSSGADPDGFNIYGDSHLVTLLRHPKRHLRECFEILLKAGASPFSKKDNSGALTCACSIMRSQRSSDAIFKIFSEHGLDLDACQSLDGRTPLGEAINRNSLIAVKSLLKFGANPSTPVTPDGELPLHLASSCDGNFEIVKALLDSGADPNLTNSKGLTPLHLAASYMHNNRNCFETVSVLLKYGADPLIEVENLGNPRSFLGVPPKCIRSYEVLMAAEERKLLPFELRDSDNNKKMKTRI